MKNRSKPRYLVPEKRKRQPKARALDLTPEHPMRGWFRMVARFVVLSTALPYLALWVGSRALNPYRVYFDDRPSSVTLDGHAMALDAANGFDLSRFALGTCRLRYLDGAGRAKAVDLHPRLGDDGGSLAISDSRVDGAPKAEFVRPR